MARILVITDRAPEDTEWKGAAVWNTVLSLAEAHHEILAVTSEDLSTFIGITHPRLTLAQPAPGFSLRYLGRWIRAFMQFQPQIVHTFALRPPGRFSCWPILAQTITAFPGVQRWSSVLDNQDYAPFPLVQSPLEVEPGAPGEAPSVAVPFDRFVVVPSPVSEWNRPHVDLLMLADYLENNSGVGACIVGGWGGLSLRERREGWSLLSNLSARVHMAPMMTVASLSRLALRSEGFWLRPLPPQSWRTVVAGFLADRYSLTAHGTPARPLPSGSAANFLSRLYSNN